MYLCLSTIDSWTLEDGFSPKAFFRPLRTVLHDGDAIAIGAYSPSTRLCAVMGALGATAADSGIIYSTTFEVNRSQHTNGRVFELLVCDGTLEALATEAERTDGQDDKPLFFDHLVAYRRGVPVVPLLCFHDAFAGGQLMLSGLYSEATVRTFAAALPANFALKRNPENYPSKA